MSKGITRHFADTFKYNIKITQAKRKRRRGEREKKPRLTKKSLWRRDENTWNSTNFPNNHTQMGIPPIRIDCTPSPSPNPCPITRAGSVSWCAWTVTARAFESNFQPAESYPTPSPGGEGDDEDEALGRGGGREKRAKKENKEREETKDKKIGRGGSERNAGQDESRQRIRLNFFARDVCPPPLFPPCLAREIQFSCPHASTHDSTYHDDNERPRSTERHPCTSCIHR